MTSKDFSPRFRIVLVRPIYSSNIGSAARALANMGGERLILLAPQAQIDSKARQGAAGAQKWLEETISYSSWEKFLESERGYKIGMTRRSGQRRKVYDLRLLLEDCSEKRPHVFQTPIYLVFGPEDSGLAANDLEQMNGFAKLQTFGDFQSLNLSQAVLLSLFTAQNAARPQVTFEHSPPDSKVLPEHITPPPPSYVPEESIRQWLIAMGFDLEKRKQSAFLTLKRLLQVNYPTQHELNVLESVLQQNIRKLNEAENSQKSGN